MRTEGTINIPKCPTILRMQCMMGPLLVPVSKTGTALRVDFVAEGSLLSAKDAPDLIETLSQTIEQLSSVEEDGHGMGWAWNVGWDVWTRAWNE